MIDKEEFEKANFEEKQKLIKKILKLATHNGFTKDDLLLLIKWQDEIIERMECCHNCKNWNWKHSRCEKKLKGDCFKASKWEIVE